MVKKVLQQLRWSWLMTTTAVVIGGAAIATSGTWFSLSRAVAADATAPQASTPPAANDRHRNPREQMREHWAAMDRHLTADQVRDIIAGKLAMSDNNNLKAGKATAAGDVVSVDITTKSGALVSTQQYSTKTGLPEWLTERLTAAPQQGQQGPGQGGPRPGFGPHGPMGGQMHGPMMRGGHGFGGGFDGGERPDAWLSGGPERDLNLTPDQAKRLVEARLITLGNPHLKVGAARENNADTITVDIVASDNSVVNQETINRHTGHLAHQQHA